MLTAAALTENDLFSAVKTSNPEFFEARTEQEILENVAPLAVPLPSSIAGLGIGNYFVPAVVNSIASRGEFVTAYTPYQPECSQGTLGAIFEFQTRVCELTGLEVSNAGLYDGSTALVEAVVMALAETGRSVVAIARSVAPATREVLATHLSGRAITIVEIPFDPHSGKIVTPELSSDIAALVVQSPNVFGVIESDIANAFSIAKNSGAVPIQIFHPMAVTLLPKPSDVGAEIAVAEGQPLGIYMSAGGPFLGLIASTPRFMRRMPGRIVGKTIDADGRDAYVLTLQTREQHIRRERATSNICTNQALMALRVTVYLAVTGMDGLQKEALRLSEKAEHISKGRRVFSGEVFNEFLLKNSDGIVLDYPELSGCSLHGVAS